MPVHNSLPSTPISINQLVLLAWKRAGLVPVEAQLSGANLVPKLEHGRQLLDLLLDNLAVEGFSARTIHFYDLPIVAGESAYTLPDTILDALEDAMFISDDNPDTKHTTGELVVKQMDLTTWQLLTNKGSPSSRPSMYVTVRSAAQVQLKVWPVPSDSGTLRLKTQRLLGSNADGRLNPDLQRYWYQPLVWMLAADIAQDSSLSPQAKADLRGQADIQKQKALGFSNERVSQCASLYYPTQWSG